MRRFSTDTYVWMSMKSLTSVQAIPMLLISTCHGEVLYLDPLKRDKAGKHSQKPRSTFRMKWQRSWKIPTWRGFGSTLVPDRHHDGNAAAMLRIIPSERSQNPDKKQWKIVEYLAQICLCWLCRHIIQARDPGRPRRRTDTWVPFGNIRRFGFG